jgi:hypothetical protein
MMDWHDTSEYLVALVRQDREVVCQGLERYRIRFPHVATVNEALVKHTLEVERSLDGGHSWQRVPLRLDIRSRLRFATLLHRDRWPPAAVDAYGVESGCLAIRFRDSWIMFDLPYRDSSSNREAEWKATYSPIEQHWTLTRLRVL